MPVWGVESEVCLPTEIWAGVFLKLKIMGVAVFTGDIIPKIVELIIIKIAIVMAIVGVIMFSYRRFINKK